MNILLILPAAEHLRVTDDFVPRRKMLRFSVLSLTTVAALTPDEHNVTIVDENVEAIDMNRRPDLVGISFMTGLAPRAYELSEQFRAKGCITVAGGFHPSLNPEESLKYFDIVVSGQAEDTWPGLLRDVKNNRYKRHYVSDPGMDLAMVPVPRRDLLKKSSQYITTHAVQTGRGCDHKCKFCSVTAFYKHQFHTRPVDNVIEELRQVPKHFMFVDDNIIADRVYARNLFKKMIPMKKRWISQCSIEIADDPELLKLAYKAGCRGLFVGIESINKKNLENMDKEFNGGESIIKKIALIRKNGIGVQAGMIVGLDSDDVTVFQQNLRFLQKARIDALQLAILTPQPGTPLREEFEKAGRIIDNNWSKYDYRHVVIKPKNMSPEQLQAGADWLYRQYYRLDRIILRAARSIFSVGLLTTYLSFRLGLTYRYSLKFENRKGYNPAQSFVDGRNIEAKMQLA